MNEIRLYAKVCSVCGRQVDPAWDHHNGFSRTASCTHGRLGLGMMEQVPWEKVEVVNIERLLQFIGEHETPVNKAMSVYLSTKKAADDPWDDTGFMEPITDAVIAAIDEARFELREDEQFKPCPETSPEEGKPCILPAGHEGAHEAVRGPFQISSWAA